MVPFKHIDIRKQNTKTFVGEFVLLYPVGREIESTNKYSNLQDLLAYVPPYLHDFYTNLKVKHSVRVAENNDDDALYSISLKMLVQKWLTIFFVKNSKTFLNLLKLHQI